MYILKNWQIIRHLDVDGAVIVRLAGEVFGHPRFRPGAAITTSSILECRPEADTLVITTTNASTYFLGRPNTYEPFARQRLVRLLEARAGEVADRSAPAPREVFDPQRTDLQLGAGHELRPQDAGYEPPPRRSADGNPYAGAWPKRST